MKYLFSAIHTVKGRRFKFHKALWKKANPLFRLYGVK